MISATNERPEGGAGSAAPCPALARTGSPSSAQRWTRSGIATRTLARLAAVALALALGLMMTAPGCKGAEPEPEPEAMPDPIPASEIERGEAACQAYQTRVCACAKARPDDADLDEACQLAPAKLSSLRLVLELNRNPGTPDERVGSSNTARRIIASCITEEASLDGQGCPRTR